VATTKKSGATDSSADALGAILEKLGAMDAKIEAVEDRIEEASKPPTLVVTKGVEGIDPYASNDGRVIEANYVDPSNLLHEGDVVRLKEGTEKEVLIKQRAPNDRKKSIVAEGVLGVVEKFGNIGKRTGEPKFRVQIQGIGTDSILYKDLELVRRA
jgi:hypothetical protein